MAPVASLHPSISPPPRDAAGRRHLETSSTLGPSVAMPDQDQFVPTKPAPADKQEGDDQGMIPRGIVTATTESLLGLVPQISGEAAKHFSHALDQTLQGLDALDDSLVDTDG